MNFEKFFKFLARSVLGYLYIVINILMAFGPEVTKALPGEVRFVIFLMAGYDIYPAIVMGYVIAYQEARFM